MAQSKYRAALLGCGHIAEKHSLGYQLAEIPIVAAADIVEENRNKLGEAFGIPESGRYEDYRQLLKGVRPEIVSICTWPPLHEEMALAAVEAGAKALIVEKPLTTNLGAADRIIEACEKAGVLLVVGHQRRYEDHWIRAKELIAEGAIGEVERIVLTHGADLVSNVVHGINLSLFLTGDPNVEWVLGQIDRSHFPEEEYRKSETAEAKAGTFGRMRPGWSYGHAVEDSSTFTARFDNGVQLNAETGQIRPTLVYITIRVLGSEGILISDTQSRLRLLNAKGLVDEQYGKEYTGVPFGKEMRDVVRVLDKELDEHPLDVKHHRKALEVALATMESSRLRRRIVLPLETKESPLDLMIGANQI